MEQKKETMTNEPKNALLEQYVAQTADENDVHFYHVDGYYNDGPDCCC